ncbi:hypothetical protein [Hymenobacter norwichensis]|uniref:hypothetical protein n=1 Tax=Hymenobacter norwichensis TaxID=223903 RepID=UPI0003B45701|nr:hypothetical protein [Hymenobacter norwichensis]
MVKQLHLMLDGPGIAIFDPHLLADFLAQQGIATANLFQLFQRDTTIGDAVIQQGLVLPIYTIPPLDYQIILNDSGSSIVRTDWVRLTTTPFPLVVGCHNKLVVADIYSLMEWDAAFYQQMPLNETLAPQVAATVAAGNYAVTIKGFAERAYAGRGPTNIGYELLLNSVASLPSIMAEQDVESFDFVLWQPGQAKA